MSEKKSKNQEHNPAEQAGESAEPGVVQTPQEAELEMLKSQLTEAQAKAQEYLEALQRERASFVNYRRRTDQEHSLVRQVASGSTIRKFLGGIDDLERALAHRPADDAWADGVELVYRKFLAVLEAEGVKAMQAEGQPFNPEFHEAIMQEPSEKYGSGTVSSVLQQGYLLGDRVLRPALVKVAQ